MTVLVEIPPMNPGIPPHRHSGPCLRIRARGCDDLRAGGWGTRLIRAGETLWEPGGGLIHYQANPGSAWCRFVAVMPCKPGEAMLTLVDPTNLKPAGTDVTRVR
jgi:hypothetical protein